MAREEAIIRHMLGEWVSELEPELVRDAGLQIVGLTFAGDKAGAIVPVIVRNHWHRERRQWEPAIEAA